ncbi:hypothetical protein CAC42_7220 [Sphaceloma murrayae]|uniref:Rhodopsin domain-containing protein n=1 Tax=Sphaceloma murrayae TaxID=2082308 RepID=A0A2K1QQ04_9PEZI|nr:hypothetical protein CAC42_7220 [Sphaceloma murrayae]
MITADIANYTTYACSAIAALLIIVRLVVSKFQPKLLDISFFIAIFGLAAIVARVIVTYYVLKLGTASDVLAKMKNTTTTDLDAEDLKNIKKGSILSLFARILTTCIIWSMNLLLLLLYRRLVAHLPWVKHAITGTFVFIALSYFAVIAATFLECRPFHLYWQISPAPGACVNAYSQTMVQCLANVITDLILMGISIPILFIQGSRATHRARIFGLIALSAFCIVVTCVRLTYVFEGGSFQETRVFWASISVAVAALVANAPVIYGSLKIMQRSKRTTYAYGDGYGMANPRAKGTADMMLEDVERMDGITKHTSIAVSHIKAGDDVPLLPMPLIE